MAVSSRVGSSDVEAEALESAIFYKSGSGKCEINKSRCGSSNKILKAVAEVIKIYRFHGFYYSGILGNIFPFFKNIFRN